MIEHTESTHGRLLIAVSDALGVNAISIHRLTGGCVGDVYCMDIAPIETLTEHNTALATSRASADNQVVVKHNPSAGLVGDENTPTGSLEIEAKMLRYLKDHTRLPVPIVLHASPSILVMTKLPGATGADDHSQHHLGECVAHLHSVTSDMFGFDTDTLIGPLRQPNRRAPSWIPFFAENRLSYMARQAANANAMPTSIAHRVDALCAKLENILSEPARPALLHGDLWSGNVLSCEHTITGIIDPAISFGHPECDLAYMTLFGCFGDAFFNAYKDTATLEPGFDRDRKPIYQLWPLLVHVRLFGGSYVSSVEATLRRYGV